MAPQQNNAIPVKLGIIGGSGLYQMSGVKIVAEHALATPFGAPSDAVVEGRIGSRTAFFLPRHGVGHRFSPSEVNYRANIHALKQLGVTHVLAVSACGIMKDDIRPGDMVVPDQIFDRTKGTRASTFFSDGIVGHVMFADPFCAEFRQVILQSVRKNQAKAHDGGTYVCMEGPQFSTRAESLYYRKTLAPAVIGMTALPEAKLAREAEMAYGMLALATDYDCWHETEEDVTVEVVLAVLKANSELANSVVKTVAELMPDSTNCDCQHAAAHAIMTHKGVIPEATKLRLNTLFGRYLKS